jgi:hypothetical protein
MLTGKSSECPGFGFLEIRAFSSKRRKLVSSDPIPFM